MLAICGLDFGTSNSTIGINHHHEAILVPLENEELKLRSAIFYNTELKELIFGQHGVDEYLAGEPGRLMMSLKSLLGSSLLNDTTLIGDSLIPYTEVLGTFINYMKKRAEIRAGKEIAHVVLGRPVIFHPNAQRDQLAQTTLEDIVKEQGFNDISFQYEPVAAGLAYENTLRSEEIVLVVDMGGGTSDFTIIKLSKQHHHNVDRSEDILANHGVRIGGTDLDKRFNLMTVMPLLGMHSLMKGSSSDIKVPNAMYHDLTSWHMLRQLYQPTAINDVRRIHQLAYDKPLIQRLLLVLENQYGHRILNSIETTKKQLSELSTYPIAIDYIEETLNIEVSQTEFNAIIQDYRNKLVSAICDTLQQARLKNTDIQAIFYTGGTTKIPIIRDDIRSLFCHAKIISGDIFGSVGLGLTLDAINKYVL